MITTSEPTVRLSALARLWLIIIFLLIKSLLPSVKKSLKGKLFTLFKPTIITPSFLFFERIIAVLF